VAESRRALVIGATGGAGGEVARALLRHGWAVRALVCDPARGDSPGVEWVPGDAMREADVVAAAAGARVIFHGANPPLYRDWRGLALPMLRNSIAAARVGGARLIFPGNIYNYGPDAGPLLREDAPQRPRTRKGQVRAEMGALLRGPGLRATVLRAGDFFGPHSRSSWFGQGVVKAGRPVGRVAWPGRPGIGHAWAYLPDFAETIARLADREAELPDFQALNFAGHWVEDGEVMAAAIREATGNPGLKLVGFPWRLAMLASPFIGFLRELREMRYLWEEPIRLDNAQLRATLGEEPHTPLVAAVRESLRGLGCLPA
jgi:nucleoside-diphosphate-sugar epimerase